MKKLTYSININAPIETVFEMMLGKATYKQWTAAFNPTSDFEGGWNKGDKIYFIGYDENNVKGGMVATIKENILNKFVSIQHLGIYENGLEITSGPKVEGWAGAEENYSFSEQNGITTLTIDVDANTEYVDYFDTTWPKALDLLKAMCETV